MAQQNQISAQISPADKATVMLHLAAIKKLLDPVFIFSLKPEERREFSKMGDKSIAFVEKALDYAVKNTPLVPTYLNVDEAQKDYALAKDLHEVARELQTISQAVDDTIIMAGAEAYQAALIFHASVKGASRSNAPGSEAIYKDLVTRFPRGSRKTKTVTP
jgi:hypothetical protein